MSKQTVKVGLVGLGYWGPNLLRNLLATKNVVVVGCAELDETRLTTIKQTRPEIFLTDNYHELLQEDIEAVIIATPPGTHFQIAKDALRSKKHVLIEKPMTTSYQEAIQLVRLAKKVRRVLMVDHVFVYSAPVRKLKELIDRNTLGTLYYFDSMRVNLGLFQKDTNVLWDLACHDLSILDYLITEAPVSISCVGGAHTKNGQIDTAYLTIKYRSNFLAHVNVNWLAPTKIRRIIIGASRKMVVYDEGNVEERIKVYDKGVVVDSNSRQRSQINYRVGDVLSPFVPADEALANMCQHFITCITHHRSPLTDGETGARVVKLLEMAELALPAAKTLRISTRS